MNSSAVSEFVKQYHTEEKFDVNDLIGIVEILRAPDGCPWDREQDHHSIRKDLIEETYEVAEALDKEDPVLLEEELGDLLLQIVFHASIEKQEDRFAFTDVADGICRKLILRHPHIFGDVTVSGTEDVLKNWNAIKMESKGQKTGTETLESVPACLPALMRSQKVQKRASRFGYDYTGIRQALGDLKSEIAELEEAIGQAEAQNADAAEKAHLREELGDVLFSSVNVTRLCGEDSEECLTASCDKFIRRFSKAEKAAEAEGTDLRKADMDTLDRLWKQAKEADRKEYPV